MSRTKKQTPFKVAMFRTNEAHRVETHSFECRNGGPCDLNSHDFQRRGYGGRKDHCRLYLDDAHDYKVAKMVARNRYDHNEGKRAARSKRYNKDRAVKDSMGE